jgi:outer membrane receptor protein involved in Fe transport
VKKNLILLILLATGISGAMGQKTATLTGKVIDDADDLELSGATVKLVGTYYGGLTDDDGKYIIKNLKPGDYTVRVSYVGYADKVYTGIRVTAGKTRKLNVKLTSQDNTFQTVTVVGDRNLMELDDANSGVSVKAKDINDMNVRNVQDVASVQAGVSKTADGLQIRGGRVYETSYLVDNISAQDPLAGTGFGVEVSSASIGELNVLTGGAGAEYGDGSAGVISTSIKEGSEKLEIAGSWQSDHLGFLNNNWNWNTDIGEFTIAGTLPGTKKKGTFFNTISFNLTDNYFENTANQLHSSLFKSNDSLYAPRQANKFTHTIKLAYRLAPGTKLTLSNSHSLSINQNTRSLQIVGFDAILRPGYQYSRSLNLDNGTTYTHHSNLTAINLKHAINKKFTLLATVGRLFTNLRADANGRPFRYESVDRVFDEQSIVTDPLRVFNPGSAVQFVYPGPGLFNNGGISGTWHDHFASEWTLKAKFNYYPKNKSHKYTFGWEQKFNEYQWVDVRDPWVGAPISIDDSTKTPSISVGSSNDIWKVKPNNGGLFFTDKISYKGIIASIGMRLNYWAPGKFADDAVNSPESPVIDQIRTDYIKNSFGLFGLRYKIRLLPKINVSFPVTSNNTLYFNYGHAMRLAHPRFLYAGLDPEFQDRSFLSNLGNPDLNPEVNVSFEVGTKSQISKDFAISVSAYSNNRFDYIVSRSVIVKDKTGRPVTKTMHINQDYAKVLGSELVLQYRMSNFLRAFFNLTYQIARGKSNSARESSLQIAQTGEVPLSSEQYLAWDRPWNTNLGFTFSYDTAIHFLPKSMKGMRLYISANYQSGYRYTPQKLEGYNNLGRPLYVSQNDQYLQERGAPWFNSDLVLSKTIRFSEQNKSGMTISVEVRNLLNRQNSQILNPVTGNAYVVGDDVPNNWRDPRYIGPEESGLPPDNPARYLPPRQILFGIKFRW